MTRISACAAETFFMEEILKFSAAQIQRFFWGQLVCRIKRQTAFRADLDFERIDAQATRLQESPLHSDDIGT